MRPRRYVVARWTRALWSTAVCCVVFPSQVGFEFVSEVDLAEDKTDTLPWYHKLDINYIGCVYCVGVGVWAWVCLSCE